ncbi:hypothetical protein MCOR27_000173 [Pyricularia oryzae]|uniref:Uncharacterized protein n=1 Tax=Pyricularia grisea TaxID=148305 RepID=A0ABQ8P128_PYRGI|nr:hypothetical protein MCOR26_000389 [Pyricularia oryzae]KAI6304987.1 hypothetical protein MCOR33_000106 [Pyricularia grisea]KAI6289426.1 hypothetical protein MCOR27_000173 [Pyricularia oryzae]KAI6332878.1 hypothetical protein MCOR30_004411 [Pyricularia oryzae]KAI6345404.1 hypothetical protein MCOR28_003608 [Pyricularia oryzae]
MASSASTFRTAVCPVEATNTASLVAAWELRRAASTLLNFLISQTEAEGGVSYALRNYREAEDARVTVEAANTTPLSEAAMQRIALTKATKQDLIAASFKCMNLASSTRGRSLIDIYGPDGLDVFRSLIVI